MIARVVSLVALTLVYWVCALTIGGMLLFGDCDPTSQACLDAKNRIFLTWLAVAVGLYLVTIVPLAIALFRRR